VAAEDREDGQQQRVAGQIGDGRGMLDRGKQSAGPVGGVGRVALVCQAVPGVGGGRDLFAIQVLPGIQGEPGAV